MNTHSKGPYFLCQAVRGAMVARGGGKFTAWLAARRWARRQEPFDLVIDQPQSNHNGGQIHFGPDGDLYIGMGAGGGAGDTGNGHGSIANGQATNTFLGKRLRIDVEGTPDPGSNYAIPPDNPFLLDPQVPNEIWAFGLRNPWRACRMFPGLRTLRRKARRVVERFIDDFPEVLELYDELGRPRCPVDEREEACAEALQRCPFA